MYPNGFVAAASSTSHISTPICSHAGVSSFTSAMLTLRNVFSNSFAVSATVVELTGTISFRNEP
ncbi:hypothetical protein D1872_282090 [compost metagenome]